GYRPQDCRNADSERPRASGGPSSTRCTHPRHRLGTGFQTRVPSSDEPAWDVLPWRLPLYLDRRSILPWLRGNVKSGIIALREGHGAEAHRVMGARAVPAGGFAACSRAVWASCLPAL